MQDAYARLSMILHVSARSTWLNINSVYSVYSVVEKSRRICRSGVAELEAPPPWERTRLEAASPWRGPVLP